MNKSTSKISEFDYVSSIRFENVTNKLYKRTKVPSKSSKAIRFVFLFNYQMRCIFAKKKKTRKKNNKHHFNLRNYRDQKLPLVPFHFAFKFVYCVRAYMLRFYFDGNLNKQLDYKLSKSRSIETLYSQCKNYTDTLNNGFVSRIQIQVNYSI